MRERRQTALDSFRSAVVSVTSLPLGYVYRLEPSSEALAQLIGLVDLERRCCPFLSFRIVVDGGTPFVNLEVTGPAEAKALIADFFGSHPQIDRPPKL